MIFNITFVYKIEFLKRKKMSNTNSLGIIGLIIGIAGASLGGISMYLNLTSPIQIRDTTGNIWVDSNEYFEVGPDIADITWNIPDLQVNFTVNLGESVYISFTCKCYYFSDIRFNTLIDGEILDEYFFFKESGEFESYSITFNELIETRDVSSSIGFGEHRVQIRILFSTAGGHLSDNCLVVQTF